MRHVSRNRPVRRSSGAVLASVLASSAAPAFAGGGASFPNPFPALGDLFGFSVSVIDSDLVVIGAPGNDVESFDEGTVYVFAASGHLDQTIFSPNLIPAEYFGSQVAGLGYPRFLVAAVDAAYLYDVTGELLQTFDNPAGTTGDVFGALAWLGGDLVLIGDPGADFAAAGGGNVGVVYLYDVKSNVPIDVFLDPTPEPSGSFGYPLAALGPDRFVAGARGASGGGELHVFDLKEGHVATIANPDPAYPFPESVAALGDRVLAGSIFEPVIDMEGAGVVYVFDSVSGAHVQTVPNPAPGEFDHFGQSIAVLGEARFAVGARLTDLSGTVFLFDAAGDHIGTLLNPAPDAGDLFGYSLSAYGCEGVLAGAPQGLDPKFTSGPGEAHIFTSLGGGCLPNYVQVVILRVDDYNNQKNVFEMSVDVVIPDETGASGVTVTTGGELKLPLVPGDGGVWSISIPFFSLGFMQESLHGLWTVDIQGETPSTSTFTFNGAALQEGSFFSEPFDVYPPGGAADIPPQAIFTWQDPTDSTAEALFVNSEGGDGGLQQDNSVLGTLEPTDQSWDPPVDLAPGFNEFEVTYADFDDTLVGPLQVVSGAIAWGVSPFAPVGYPATTPLAALGSATIVTFEVVATGIVFDPPAEVPAAGEPSVHATGDVDRDGDIDVVVAIPDPDPQVAGVVQVFRNQGTDIRNVWQGLIADPPFPAGREPGGIALGFFDADFHPDLAVTNAGDDTVSIFLGNGDGTFAALPVVPTGNRPSAVSVGDFNEDGLTDLAVSNEDDDTVLILLGDGLGGFTDGTALPSFTVGVSPVMVSTGDFDNNKCPDLSGANQGAAAASAGTAGTVFVAIGSHGGNFFVTLYPVGVQPSDVANAELNRDGFGDIAAANTGDGTVSILVNLGDGTFAPGPVLPVGADPLSVEAADFDGDTRPDLAVVADDPDLGPSVQVLKNTSTFPGEVRFAAPVAFGVEAQPLFVVSADFDGDGVADLVTVNADPEEPTGGSVTVLITEPTSPLACPADLDGDGVVRSDDMMDLLNGWGPCDPELPCRADLNGDGEVGIVDFLLLLATWGACP
jgi:hypothetical protein